MADKKWQAGGGITIPQDIVLCLIALILPAAASGQGSSLVRYLEEAGPDVVSDVVLGGLVVCSFLVAIALWFISTLRRFKRSQLRRNAFVSSALNNLKQGVVITNSRQRIVLLNDRYLEIYGLARSYIPPDITGPELVELRRQRGELDVSVDEFYAR